MNNEARGQGRRDGKIGRNTQTPMNKQSQSNDGKMVSRNQRTNRKMMGGQKHQNKSKEMKKGPHKFILSRSESSPKLPFPLSHAECKYL